jgi:hypothetical protein
MALAVMGELLKDLNELLAMIGRGRHA